MAAASGEWIGFRRTDPEVVVTLVRRVAEAGDPGEFGDGVEVVIEPPARTPRWSRWWWTRWRWNRRWWARTFRPAQARLVVVRAGGAVRYPFDVRLISPDGGGAARRAGARPGWAISDSAGMAFLIQKGRPDDPFDWAGLVTGALVALDVLAPGSGEAGWRVRVDRSVHRVRDAPG